MVRPRILPLFLTALLAAAAASAQVARPLVFASGEGFSDTGALVSQIGAVDLEFPGSWLLFEDAEYSFEDVVVGPGPATAGGSTPPLYVYACDPTAGLIIRFDPSWVDDGEPLGIDDVEIVYRGALVGGSGNNLSPQCGWFTSRGDLIFTDREYEGAWICRGVGFEHPGSPGTSEDPLCLYSENLFPLGDEEFAGAGITQAAGGDALVVDTNWPGDQGKILRFAIDGPTGTFPNQAPTPLDLVDESGDTVFLDGPLGIARLSNGEIFVAAGFSIFNPPDAPEGAPAVLRFDGVPDGEGGKDWVLQCVIPLEDDCGQADAYFLEAAADDTVYVAATYDDSNCPGGSIWKIPADPPQVPADNPDDPYCTAQKVFPTDGGTFDWTPQVLVGLGLSPTGTFPSSSGTAPEYVLDFNDHVFELTAPDWCQVEAAFAQETPASCLQTIIDDHVPYDGTFDAYPVLFLGDKALGQTYYIDGACAPEVDGTFRYAVSAYTEELTNPRIIRCEVSPPQIAGLPGEDVCFPAGSDVCEVIDLASFFPGEGVLPEDGRISGTTRTSDFSQFFVVDSGPDGYSGDGTPGCSCGFRPPVANVDGPFAFGKSVFREGRSIPFKALFTAGACATNGACQGRGHIAPAGVLLSIARLYDADGARAFGEIDFDCNGAGCSEEPYFEPPNNPKSGYHMNVRTDGWLPGTYIATLTVTNRGLMPGDPEYVVPVFVTYFDIVP